MKVEAQRLGREVVDREKHLDGLFAQGTISQESLTAVVGEIAALQRRAARGPSSGPSRDGGILADDQVARYERHRGYHGAPDHPHNP